MITTTRERLHSPNFHRFLILLWMVVLLTGSTSSTGFFNQVTAALDLTIVAAGDWGCTANTRDTVSNIKNSSANLVLALGDYSYSDTPSCWLNIVKPINSITKIFSRSPETLLDTGLESLPQA